MLKLPIRIISISLTSDILNSKKTINVTTRIRQQKYRIQKVDSEITIRPLVSNVIDFLLLARISLAEGRIQTNSTSCVIQIKPIIRLLYFSSIVVCSLITGVLLFENVKYAILTLVVTTPILLGQLYFFRVAVKYVHSLIKKDIYAIILFSEQV